MTPRIRRPALIGAIALLLLVLTAAKFSYHSTCTRCLARLEGYRFEVASLTILSGQRALAEGAGSQAAYETAFGLSCPHNFHVGTVEWKGLISSGQLPAAEEAAYKPRLQALKALFDLQHRLPNRENTQTSYHEIDRLFPEGLALREIKAIPFDLDRRSKDLEQFK